MNDFSEFIANQRQAAAKHRSNLPAVRAETPPIKVVGPKATIRLYQYFDGWGEFWGMSATEFAAELDALPEGIDTIELRINSGGGEVFEALTVMNALRSHPARVVAVVEGMAASAASFIAASADETVMMPNSRLMIHPVRGVVYGTAPDLRTAADFFDELTLESAQIYATKSGTPADEWLDIMEAGDRWYSADEAVQAGLADRVETVTTTESAPSNDGTGDTGTQRFDPSLSLALLDL